MVASHELLTFLAEEAAVNNSSVRHEDAYPGPQQTVSPQKPSILNPEGKGM